MPAVVEVLDSINGVQRYGAPEISKRSLLTRYYFAVETRNLQLANLTTPYRRGQLRDLFAWFDQCRS